MKYKNIYVLAPLGISTGGVELSHQLVDYLRDNNQNAFIVYISNWKISEKQSVTESYKKYNIATTKMIEDSSENILVLPEIYCDFIFQFKYIQIACWWMSVNNHYNYSNFWEGFKFNRDWIKRLHMIKQYLFNGKYHFKNRISDLQKQGERIIHLYQSHYAQFHLYKLGMHKILPLFDYVNDELISKNNNKTKDNIILYNPAKGFEFTKKIIDRMVGYNFIPLKGLSRTQLNELMDKAKLYIDFGEFPGKDRLPREAALHDCCIVTGRNGASFFYEDLPINDEYKFDAKSCNINKICEKISNIITDYDDCIKDFDIYQKAIKKEKGIFFSQIDYIFL